MAKPEKKGGTIGVKAKVKKKEKEAAQPPPPRIGNTVVHETHALYQKQGVTWCTRCGNYAAGKLARSLGVACIGEPGVAGRSVLRRLERGLTPIASMAKWPVAADVAPPEGEISVPVQVDKKPSLARAAPAAAERSRGGTTKKIPGTGRPSASFPPAAKADKESELRQLKLTQAAAARASRRPFAHAHAAPHGCGYRHPAKRKCSQNGALLYVKRQLAEARSQQRRVDAERRAAEALSLREVQLTQQAERRLRRTQVELSRADAKYQRRLQESLQIRSQIASMQGQTESLTRRHEMNQETSNLQHQELAEMHREMSSQKPSPAG